MCIYTPLQCGTSGGYTFKNSRHLRGLVGASNTHGDKHGKSNERLRNKMVKSTIHSPVSAAAAASWTSTAVRSFEAALGPFAPGVLEVQEAPGAPRAACGAAKGTWRSPDRRSSLQALVVAAAY